MGLHYEQRCSTHRRGRTSKVSGLHVAWDFDWKWKLRKEASLSVVWDRDLSLSIRTQEVFLVYMSLQVLRCVFGFLAGLTALGKMGKAPGAGISHLCVSTSGHGWEDPEGLSQELTWFRVCLVGCIWGYQCWVSHHAVGTHCRGLSYPWLRFCPRSQWVPVLSEQDKHL